MGYPSREFDPPLPCRAGMEGLLAPSPEFERRRTMTRPVQPIPEGYHAITPHLVVHDANQAIAFYKEAFGAEELVRMPTPDGRLMHAEVKIGDSPLFVVDEFPEMGGRSPRTLGGTAVSIHLYVED